MRLQTRQKADFFVLADKVLEDLEKAGKYYPYKNTKVAFGKLEQFEGERVLPLKNIDTAYLEKFERYIILEFKNNPNTIRKNFGAIRKVIRMALKSNLMSKDPFLYFEGVKRKKPASKTKLSIEQIRRIEALKLDVHSWLWNARNAFLFSFYSGSIRFGDICCLKWSNISKERLSKMNKNNKGFSTQLNDQQKEILSRYSGVGDDFIFPFLDSDHNYNDPIELRKEISRKNALVNKNLKKLVNTLHEKVDKKEIEAQKISPKLLKPAVEIGLNKYGDSFDRDLADFLELKSFEQLIEAKIQEINKPQEAENPMLQVKSEPLYSLEDTRSWFLVLCENPDYQRHDGSPYITAIDAELRKRHSNTVGQTPSETTIKNHRRKLGFMQK